MSLADRYCDAVEPPVKRVSPYLDCTAKHDQDFPAQVASHMKTSAPLVKFLCDANDLMF